MLQIALTFNNIFRQKISFKIYELIIENMPSRNKYIHLFIYFTGRKFFQINYEFCFERYTKRKRTNLRINVLCAKQFSLIRRNEFRRRDDLTATRDFGDFFVKSLLRIYSSSMNTEDGACRRRVSRPQHRSTRCSI